MKRINLIPEEARGPELIKWVRKYILRSTLPKIIVIFLAAACVLYVWQQARIIRYNSGIEQKKQQVRQLRQELSRARSDFQDLKKRNKNIRSDIARVRKKIDVLEKMETRRVIWSDILSAVSELLPSDLWCTRIALDEDQAKIRGATLNNVIVSSFMNAIDGSEYFRNTGFNFTEKKELNKKTVISFEIITWLDQK